MSVLNLAQALVAQLDGGVYHGTVPSTVPWDTGCKSAADGAIGTRGTVGAHGTGGTTGLKTRPNSLRYPAAGAERPSIIAKCDGCDGGEAEAYARGTTGFPSWSDLANSRQAEISAALDRLPGNDPDKVNSSTHASCWH